MPRITRNRRKQRKPQQLSTRTVYFNNPYDPYILQHPDENELDGSRLETLFGEWLETTAEPDDHEEFEKFLDWLVEEKGFISLIASDSSFCFRTEIY